MKYVLIKNICLLTISVVLTTPYLSYGLGFEIKNETDGQIKINTYRLSDQVHEYPIEFTMERQTCLVSKPYIQEVTVMATSGSAQGTRLALKLPRQIDHTVSGPSIRLTIKNGPANNQLEFISEPADFFERQ